MDAHLDRNNHTKQKTKPNFVSNKTVRTQHGLFNNWLHDRKYNAFNIQGRLRALTVSFGYTNVFYSSLSLHHTRDYTSTDDVSKNEPMCGGVKIDRNFLGIVFGWYIETVEAPRPLFTRVVYQ